MGFLFSKILDSLSSKQNYRILMLGLDGAGKTTILFNMKLGEVIKSVPTIGFFLIPGFNYETVEYKNVKFQVWDVGGQDKIRIMWKYYFQNTKGLIFVIDSSDNERMELAKETLHSILQDEDMRDVPVLILANKQDISQISADEVKNIMNLQDLKGQKWLVQPTVAIKNKGIADGLDWLVDTLKGKKGN